MLGKKIYKNDLEMALYVEKYKSEHAAGPEVLEEYKALQAAAEALEAAEKAGLDAEELQAAEQALEAAQSALEVALETARAELDMQANEYARKQTQAVGADYAETAAWCNENGATIVDQGEYYEVVPIPPPTAEDLINAELAELQAYLASTDYIAIKIAEGVATREDYAEKLAKRQEARERINELRNELAELETADDN